MEHIRVRLMPVLVLTVGVCGAPIAVHAQRGAGGAHPGGHAPAPHANTPATPVPTSAGLSISRPIGTGITSVRTNPPLGMEPDVRSPFTARPGTYTAAPRGPRSSGIPSSYGFGVTGYGDPTLPDRQPASRDQGSGIGVLYVDASPGSAAVFVDTAYVGTVDDLDVTGVRLSRGRHWLDIQAPEYETKTVAVDITADQPLRYRVDLTPARRSPLVVIPPHPPQTMYAIPGCYGGNRPPVAAALPSGCDIAQVRVIRPQRN